MKRKIGMFAGLVGASLLASQAMATQTTLEQTLIVGLNQIAGQGFGLDENLIGPGYVTPNGTPGTATGTIGMTESLFTTGRAGASNGGLNVPQPMVLPASDPRSTIINPLTGAATYGARTGALLGWESSNFTNIQTGNTSTPFYVTGVAYNLTPARITDSNNTPLDDGLAPGSKALDGIPDTIPFTIDPLTGLRSASITLTFFGPEDGAAFGGTVPAALIPRVNLFEGGVAAGFGPTPPATALKESDFNVTTGAVTGTDAAFGDGTLLLTGEIADATANLKWQEQTNGTFLLTIGFQGTMIYDGGSLFSEVANDPAQTISAQWTNILFPVGTDGEDFNGNDVFDFRGGGDTSIGGAFSSDQAFDTTAGVPEPVSAGLGLMGLASLAGYVTRRRRA